MSNVYVLISQTFDYLTNKVKNFSVNLMLMLVIIECLTYLYCYVYVFMCQLQCLLLNFRVKFFCVGEWIYCCHAFEKALRLSL